MRYVLTQVNLTYVLTLAGKTVGVFTTRQTAESVLQYLNIGYHLECEAAYGY